MILRFSSRKLPQQIQPCTAARGRWRSPAAAALVWPPAAQHFWPGLLKQQRQKKQAVWRFIAWDLTMGNWENLDII